MKFFKSTFIFLSLFLCSLLSAQEAQKSFSITNEKKDADSSVIKTLNEAQFLAEEFIHKMLTGEAYDINIGNIQLLSDYQLENPIKCHFQIGGKDNICLDEASYKLQFDMGDFKDEPNLIIIKPFAYLAKAAKFDANKSIIIPFVISLKTEFERKLKSYLDEINDGKHIMSYRNLPQLARDRRTNNYLSCNTDRRSSGIQWGVIGRCTSPLAFGGELVGSDWDTATSFIIDYVDRNRKEVTYYNLNGFKEAFLKGRKHRFLNNICETVKGVRGSFLSPENQLSMTYINTEHVQFDDIAVTINDKDGNELNKIVINTHQEALLITTSLKNLGRINEDSTYGIVQEGNFIFTYRLGSYLKESGTNIHHRKSSDHVGMIGTIGHLITDRKGDTFSACRSTRGHFAEFPAFTLVSKYEYNLIIQFDHSDIGKMNSIKIEYVPGLTSTDTQYHPLDGFGTY